jgi:hypothetical protein
LSEIFVPVCSITTTRRKRFLWAAWWSGPPTRDPFRKPDASVGGARTRADALGEAERAAGRPLVEIDGRWARAWSRVLVGQAAWSEREKQAVAEGETPHAQPPRLSVKAAPVSIWSVLGVTAKATLEEIKRAFRARARETHPDHGGNAVAFRAVHAAYEEAVRRREKQARRPKRR